MYILRKLEVMVLIKPKNIKGNYLFLFLLNNVKPTIFLLKTYDRKKIQIRKPLITALQYISLRHRFKIAYRFVSDV